MKVNNIFPARSKLLLYTAFVMFVSIFAALQLNTSNAGALSPSDFKPGRIIDDAVFYNSKSMTAQQIQTFLNEKMPFCDTNGTQNVSYYYNPDTKYVSYGTWQSGASWVTTTRAVFGERTYQYRMSLGLPDNGSRIPYKCLKNFTMDTPQQPAASGLCSQINAMTNATAAQIIKAVADACGINPQVILVILEKEQSLVQGDNWPFGTRWSHAMGYACPDTAACATEYEGFFKQVYHGAKQYKIYQRSPQNYNYRAGQNNIILYNPNGQCGSSTVFIENQATAGLYNYTPYQPNQATINWKLGSGGAVSSAYPGCGAFGNINFFMMFSNWFGNPTYSIKGSIGNYYEAIDGKNVLGDPFNNEKHEGQGVWWQCFRNGCIIGSAKTGYWESLGPIRDKWGDIGYQTSAIGLPVGPVKTLENEVSYQQYQQGAVVGSEETGYWVIKGSIYKKYSTGGKLESSISKFGLPKSDEKTEGGFWWQDYQNKTIFGKSGKYYEVYGDIKDYWYSLSGWRSKLGYPVSDVIQGGSGESWQHFSGGSIISSPDGETWESAGSIRKYWASTGYQGGPLGYPTGPEVFRDGIWSQTYENGSITSINGVATHTINQPNQ